MEDVIPRPAPTQQELDAIYRSSAQAAKAKMERFRRLGKAASDVKDAAHGNVPAPGTDDEDQDATADEPGDDEE